MQIQTFYEQSDPIMNNRNGNHHIPTGQDWLIKKFAAAGYNNSKSDGICYGVAETAAHLIMADNDVVNFNNLMYFINNTPEDEFNRELANSYGEYLKIAKLAKDKGRDTLKNDELAGKPLHLKMFKREYINKAMVENPTLDNYLLMHALFNEIEIFHSLTSHKDVANNKYVTQQSTVAWDWILKSSHQNNESITKLDSFTCLFKEKELEQLFTEIEKNFKKSDIKDPVRFGLSSLDHRISVIYLPNKGWAYVDANYMPAEIITQKSVLANKICNSFFNDDKAAIAIQTYAFNKNKAAIEKQLCALKASETYQKIRQVDLWKINTTDNDGVNWLTIAANMGDTDAVHRLLEGMQPTFMTKVQQVLRPYLRLKADPNHVTKNNSRSLERAISHGHLAIVQDLLEHGASANEANGGWSPLYNAVAQGQFEIAAALIEKGADVNFITKLRLTPLTQAIMDNNKTLVALLLEHGADINILNSMQRTPLMTAADYQVDVEIVELLIKHNADVNAADQFNCSAAYNAVNKNSLAILECLLVHGANPNNIYFGKSLLQMACEQNNIAMAECLIAHGATPINPKALFDDPLIAAAAKNQASIAALLINNGSDINITNIMGETPLIKAIRAGHEDMVRLLISYGADINKRTLSAGTAHEAAVKCGNQAMIDLLNQANEKNDASNNNNANTKTSEELQTTDVTNNYAFNQQFLDAKANANCDASPLLFQPTERNEEKVQEQRPQLKITNC